MSGEIMTKHPRHGFLAVIAALVLALPLLSFAYPRQMEALNRGLAVSNLGKSGVLVSWRLLGTEDPNTEFNLYRDGEKIASIGKNDATNYLDKDGKMTSKYTVAAVIDGKEGIKKEPSVVFDSTVAYGGISVPYKVLKLDRPASQVMPDSDKTVCNYYPDDMSVGDLDGDGEYELVVKWIPDNYKDNSQSMVGSYTGTVFIDAYELDGTKLWRINLGKNIRAGAHYTQFQVYDYDGDGKAEMIVKTGDGTIDGKGKVIGDSTKDYRNASGIIIEGPEYLTVFRGSDGAEITTIDYVPSRDIREFGPYDSLGLNWGDTYGNRCDRFLAATAYLDGIHPSLITARGYYTAAYVVAFDFDGKNLKQRWFHKSETPGEGLFRQGNLNIVVGDLDDDGKDEIVYGGAALNSDGTLRYSTGLGYGYAAYVGDFDPDHAGREVWAIHSDYDSAEYIAEFRDDKGNIIFGDKPTLIKENGRAMVADIDSTSRGYEMWSYIVNDIHSAKGTPIKLDKSLTPDGEEFRYLGSLVPTSFRIYYDGDLQDELLDGPVISKFNSVKRTIETYFQGDSTLGLIGNQSVKNYPGLVADMFGDWREEMIFRSERDSSKIYILSTPVTTPHRLYSLMHDAQYRQAVAWQNTAYNLPPHPSYYLPDMVKKLIKPDVYAVGDSEFAVYPDAVLEKVGTASEIQTVALGKKISELRYNYLFCSGVKVEGLPAGVSAKIDSSAMTVKISGKPKKVGSFKFSLKTVGSKAENVSLEGLIVVTDTSVVDAAKAADGKGSVETEDKGYTGDGYYDFENSKSSFATWKVVSSADAKTTMNIRYSNGDKRARDMILVVNDEEIGTINMAETGDWSTWKTVAVEIELDEGENEITLKSTIKQGGPDVDAFYFDVGGVKIAEDEKSSLPEVVHFDRGFFYRPSTGTLFTSVSGFAEVSFYDLSGAMRGAVSGYVTAGESVLALERGALSEGMYVVKVKLNGKIKQKSLFKR
jgi:rhamnogalacturonan endolyase